MTKISAVIITNNEEANLGRCLNSIEWVDEIVVVDSGSTDKTRAIARQAGARLYDVKWNGFGHSKNFGVMQANGEWILSIDADEEVSPELAEEIKSVLQKGSSFDAFHIPRRTMFLGRWINHCGWYPDRVLRLFLKSKGGFNSAIVHEEVIIPACPTGKDGKVGNLKGELRHYSYPTLELYIKKSNRYTSMGAEKAFRNGKKASWFDLVVKPPASFFKHYLIKQGFRDGWEGFLISVLSAVAVLLKYAKLRDMTRPAREK